MMGDISGKDEGDEEWVGVKASDEMWRGLAGG